jgi:spore maturation protein CgeB
MKILVVGWQALPDDLELIPFLPQLGETDSPSHPLIEGGVVWFWVRNLDRLGHEVRFFDHLWPRLLPRTRLAADPALYRDVVLARRGDAELAAEDAGRMNRELLAAVRAFRPDLVLTHQAERITSATLDEIGRSALTATWVGVDPIATSRHAWMKTLAHYRHVFCAVHGLLERLRAAGVSAHFLSFAFDPEIHAPPATGKTCDVGMVGSHKYPRRRLFRRLAGARPALALGIWGRGWPDDDLLRPHFRGPAWHHGLTEAIAKMRAHLNLPQVSANEDINMRVFETAGIGTPLLSPPQKGLAEHFTPGQDVVTWSSFEELVEKARFLRDHPDEAATIGATARARALANYTYGHRFRQILEVMG